MHRLLVTVTAAILLSACSSAPPKTAAEAPASAPVKPTAVVTPPVTAAETEAQRLARIIKTLASNSIYFDFDEYTVKPEYEKLLKQDYEFLKSSPKIAVTLIGNADEHGSTEYNLALGQKRAESVAHALRLLGATSAQIEAVSYGEEKPRATCHEERCWAENRRVDFDFGNSAGAK